MLELKKKYYLVIQPRHPMDERNVEHCCSIRWSNARPDAIHWYTKVMVAIVDFWDRAERWMESIGMCKFITKKC